MTQLPLAQVSEALAPAFAAGDPDNESKVLERANVERIGQMVHAISRGRFDELRQHLAYDVTYEMAVPARVPWVRQALGPEDVTNAIAANFRSVRDQRTEPLALVSQGDTVMVMARESGHFAESGEPYEVLLSQQYTFRDGRLAAFRSVVGEVATPGERT
jgi:ketosteroid isomerase-like protein